VWDKWGVNKGASKENRGGGGATSCKMGQLISGMGLEWTGICTNASKVTTLSWGFSIRRPADLIMCIVQYCINTIYFSPLLVKNKPREGAMNVRLFLALLVLQIRSKLVSKRTS
jgi:hypothetical protein